jgi:hypothetical protein
MNALSFTFTHNKHNRATFRNLLVLLRWGVVSPSPKLQAGGTPYFGCPRLLIQYIRSYPPYLEAFTFWLRLWTGGGLCEHGNEPLGSVKGGEFR